jgi:hypothetical protein
VTSAAPFLSTIINLIQILETAYSGVESSSTKVDEFETSGVRPGSADISLPVGRFSASGSSDASFYIA